jgi:hypothetical protein
MHTIRRTVTVVCNCFILKTVGSPICFERVSSTGPKLTPARSRVQDVGLALGTLPFEVPTRYKLDMFKIPSSSVRGGAGAKFLGQHNECGRKTTLIALCESNFGYDFFAIAQELCAETEPFDVPRRPIRLIWKSVARRSESENIVSLHLLHEFGFGWLRRLHFLVTLAYPAVSFCA